MRTRHCGSAWSTGSSSRGPRSTPRWRSPATLAGLPQDCLRNDRMSLLAGEGRTVEDAMRNELRLGLASLAAGAAEGAARFAAGAGRHGAAAPEEGT